MTNKTLAGIVLALSFWSIAVLYMLRIGGEQNVLITNIVYLLPPLVACISGVFAVFIYGDMTNRHARGLLSTSLGIGLFFIGEVLWFYYKFFLHADPYPSAADVFYLAAYPFLFFGLLTELKTNTYQLKDINIQTGFFMTFFSGILSFVVYYFGVYIAYDPSATLLSNMIAIGYGIGDYFLIIPCIFILKVLVTYRKGKLFTPWLAIFLAFVTMLFADVLFAIYRDSYSASTWPYTLIDLFWVASYLLFTYGFLSIRFNIQEIHKRLQDRTNR